MSVALGRAACHRAGRPGRGRARRPGADRRPQDRAVKPTRDEVRRHGQLGAYQLAVEAGRLRGARGRAPGARVLAARRGGRAHDVEAPGHRSTTDDEPGWARDLVEEVPPRWRRRLHRTPGPLRHLPGQGLLPRLRRGEAAVRRREYGPRHPLVDGRRRGVGPRVPEAPSSSPGARASAHAPTPEQVAVIEAPLRPLLVVAGPGRARPRRWPPGSSGSSPTASSAPTRCSGSPSPARPRASSPSASPHRLAALREAGLWAPPADDGAAVLDDVPPCRPTTRTPAGSCASTGCGSASRPRAGCSARRPRWQVAHEAVVVVGRADGRRREGRVDRHDRGGRPRRGDGRAPRRADERLAHLDEVVAALEAVARRDDDAAHASRGARGRRRALRERRAILPLVERYHDLKRSRDAMDFADQMALAARIATTVPEVGGAERARFRAVLLDEFQDTSEAQLQLLGALFVAAGEPVPVTAVGDPHQSIYGWRGASSTTSTGSAATSSTPSPPTVLHLSTSWRNDRAVPRRRQRRRRAAGARRGCRCASLTRAPAPAPGHVAVARLATIEDEAGTSPQVARRGARPAAHRGGPVPQAVPVRPGDRRPRGARRPVRGRRPRRPPAHPRSPTSSPCSRSCRTPPAVTASCACSPGRPAGSAPPTSTGSAAWARGAGSGRPRAAADLARDASEQASIVEALDDLPAALVGPGGQRDLPGGLEPAGRPRRRRAAPALAHRPRAAELVAEAEVALGLDIEVLARPGWTPGAARAHLDAFADVAATFSASADRADARRFLAWLDAAVDEERGLDLGWIEARPDAVQVMTVHAAKGLEWDVVAVPGPGRGLVPRPLGRTRVVDGAGGHPPPPTRAGSPAARRPLRPARRRRRPAPLRVVAAAGWDDVAAEHQRFREAVAEHGIVEERRLAYVAVTRARSTCLLTATWARRATPRVTSRFLEEVRGVGLAVAPGALGRPAARRRPDRRRTPHRAGGERRLADDRPRGAAPRCSAGPGAVADPSRALAAGPDGRAVSPRWDAEIPMLLDERARRRRRSDVDVELPAHLSTSALVALAEDAERFTLDLRRPMPVRPGAVGPPGHGLPRLGRGALRAGGRSSTSTSCPARPTTDAGDDRPRRALRASFLASEWADRTPSRSRRASRRCSTASPCAGGSTRSSRRPTRRPTSWVSSTGRPGRRPPGRAAAGAAARGLPRRVGAGARCARGAGAWGVLPRRDGRDGVARAARRRRDHCGAGRRSSAVRSLGVVQVGGGVARRPARGLGRLAARPRGRPPTSVATDPGVRPGGALLRPRGRSGDRGQVLPSVSSSTTSAGPRERADGPTGAARCAGSRRAPRPACTASSSRRSCVVSTSTAPTSLCARPS